MTTITFDQTETKKKQRRLQEIADYTTHYQQAKSAYFKSKTRTGADHLVKTGDQLMKVQTLYGQSIIKAVNIKLRVDQAKADLSSGMFDKEVSNTPYINKGVGEMMARLSKLKNNAANN